MINAQILLVALAFAGTPYIDTEEIDCVEACADLYCPTTDRCDPDGYEACVEEDCPPVLDVLRGWDMALTREQHDLLDYIYAAPQFSIPKISIGFNAPDVVQAGEPFTVQVLAESPIDMEAATVEVHLSWTAGEVSWLGGEYPWLVQGFHDDSQILGLNLDLADGDAWLQCWSQPADPFGAPGVVGELEFTVAQPGIWVLTAEPELTLVLGTEAVGQDVTGSLGSVTVEVEEGNP